jgi:hypothetical protein
MLVISPYASCDYLNGLILVDLSAHQQSPDSRTYIVAEKSERMPLGYHYTLYSDTLHHSCIEPDEVLKIII